jgi:hypothetical protein
MSNCVKRLKFSGIKYYVRFISQLPTAHQTSQKAYSETTFLHCTSIVSAKASFFLIDRLAGFSFHLSNAVNSSGDAMRIALKNRILNPVSRACGE